MIAQAEEQNVHLVFLLRHRLGTDYAGIIPVFDRLPPENRIAVADPEEYPALYAKNLSWDAEQLNRRGAGEFSRSVAKNLPQVAGAQDYDQETRKDKSK